MSTIQVELTKQEWMASHRLLSLRKGWRVAEYEGKSAQAFLDATRADLAMLGEAVLRAMKGGAG